MREIILKLPLFNLAYWWNPERDNSKSHVIILNNATLDFLIGKIKEWWFQKISDIIKKRKIPQKIYFLNSNFNYDILTCLFRCANRSFKTFSSCKISKNRIISWSVQFGFRFRLSANPKPKCSEAAAIIGAKYSFGWWWCEAIRLVFLKMFWLFSGLIFLLLYLDIAHLYIICFRII